MSDILIQQYYTRLEKVIQYGGSYNETAIRNAFYILLNSFCESKNFELIPEFSQKDAKIRPDGTVKDRLCQDIGYWESKGPADNLDAKIQNKFDKGYPAVNILFENSDRAVLFQKGVKIMDISMKNAEKLEEILSKFLSYKSPELLAFYDAIEKFSLHLPNILTMLREKIAEESQRNPQFQQARDKFLTLCRNAVNPHIMPEDVREMMIQHILTEEIFLTVFNESMFHRENNIARELNHVVCTFFTGEIKHHTLDSIENYYLSIKRAASNIANHNEKQKFLKALYENFYRIYNQKAADRLGIFYTPNEIVSFMVESTDYLLNKCFGKLLKDENVRILDPAVGTGTFVTELIEYLPKNELPQKYREDIHCNEVSILPYYIASLNIEFTYKQKMGKYSEFKNICFLDTLEYTTFNGKQYDMFSMTVENTKRIREQNSQEIFVIIGNPPYNANQQNENDDNKNREYPKIDERIRNTYIAQSTAQKTKLYDMYSRFFRWATDRIGDKEGIVAFVSNSSFIDAKTFDGFRKVISEEFDEVHIVDLGGNMRKQEKSNVFGIRVGVAISFMIKYCNRRESLRKKHKNRTDEPHRCRIYYYRVPEYDTAAEKLNFLAMTKLWDIDFRHIIPDENHNWINLTDNDFDELLPVANKETKLAKKNEDEAAIFKLFSLGVVTNRDAWVYDFDKKNLSQKVKYLIDFYNQQVKQYHKLKDKPVVSSFIDYGIKWTRAVKKDLASGKRYKYNKNLIIKSLYRPFVKKKLYFGRELNEMQFQHPNIFPTGCENKVIMVSTGQRDSFYVLSTDCIPNLDIYVPNANQCLPFYRYDKNGTRLDNITDWGLNQFISHYNNSEITKEDIFHYVYAVLHNPEYRQKYEQNLKRELPRIPFYEDFHQWAARGRELMNLHISFETVEPYPLERRDIPNVRTPQPKLKADKDSGAIIIDTATTLYGVPKIAWEYKLGTYSALQWILEQYKEKKIKDPTVAEKFDSYRFSDYKEHVIDLLMRVCTVSVRTMKIVEKRPGVV